MITVTIKWGTDGEEKRLTTLSTNQHQWFMKGVDEAEGWLKYEIVEDELPPVKENKPEAGKLYALTGAPGSKCIANGNTWAESVVGEESEVLVGYVITGLVCLAFMSRFPLANAHRPVVTFTMNPAGQAAHRSPIPVPNTKVRKIEL